MEHVKNFKELVEGCVREKPNAAGFRWLENNRIKEKTYSEFQNDINALGTYFYYNGLKKSRIAVIGENSYEWILTYYTTVIGGGVIVPVDRDLKTDAIINVLRDSGAKALIYTDSYNAIIEDVRKGAGVKVINKNSFPELIAEGKTLLEKGKDKYLRIEPNEREMSTIIYTSGTTGKPKGVMLCQQGIMEDCWQAAQYVKVTGASMLVLPIHHTFGFTAGVAAVMFFRVPLCINKSLRTFMTDMQVFKPNNMFVVPMFIEAMHKKIWKSIADKNMTTAVKALIKTSNGLRKIGIDRRKTMFSQIHESFGGNLSVIISGGAALDPMYVKEFDDFGITLLNGYGITECSPVVAVNSNNGKDENRIGSVGLVLPDTDVKIINEDDNGNGEICVKSDIVMLGYYNNKEATAEAMENGWFNTGDIGYLDEDNYLYISGRKKNLIILNNGKNIYPEELEELIMRIPDVIEVVVYNEDETITAEIYTENPAAVQRAMKVLNRGLPVYKVIKNIKFRTTEFEKTTTKKIKRALVGRKR
ncbi:MAG: AMP-binding protein [Clostridia bacterium]|nr:AMP-binding protein [Clostridia bacterium]